MGTAPKVYDSKVVTIDPEAEFEMLQLFRALTQGDRASHAKLILESPKVDWLRHGLKPATAAVQHKDPAQRLDAPEHLLTIILDFARKYEATPDYKDLRHIIATSQFGLSLENLVDQISEIGGLDLDMSNVPYLIDQALDCKRRSHWAQVMKTAGLRCMGKEGPEAIPALVAKYQALDYRETEVTTIQGNVLATDRVINDEDEAVTVSMMGTSYADIEMLPTNWLWPDKIPSGAICWWAGKGGCGKSASLCDLIARVSSGLAFPDGSPNTLGPKKVLFGSSEDDTQRTLKPRLEAARANMANIIRLDGVVTRDGIHSMFSLKDNLPLLIKVLKNNPEIGLVCLDAISSFWGDVNSNAETEMKPLMDELKRVLEQTQCTFVGIIHNNKRSDSDALGKVMGAGCIANSARAVFGFGFDPEDETRKRRMMSLIKCNLTESMDGLYFTIESAKVGDLTAARVVWGEKHSNTADDVIKAENDKKYNRRESKMIDRALAWLPPKLEKGPRLATELIAEAKREEGISYDVLTTARHKLGITSRQATTGVHEWTMAPRIEERFAPEDVI